MRIFLFIVLILIGAQNYANAADIDIFSLTHRPSIPSGLTFNAEAGFELFDIPQCQYVTFELSLGDEIAQTSSLFLCPNSTYEQLVVKFEDVETSSAGFHKTQVSCPGCSDESSIVSDKILVLPGILTLLPPAITIFLAATTHQVVPSLLIGVFVSSFLSVGTFDPITAFRWTFNYFIETIADDSYAIVSAFFIFLGSVIGMIGKSGGSHGLAAKIGKYANTSQSAMIGLLSMMCILIVDEFCNIFISGLALQPLVTRMRVSPEKLAFLLDSMGSPPSSVFLISSWIGFIISSLKAHFESNGIALDPFPMFIRSIQYCFYPLVGTIMPWLVVLTKRDIGPMVKIELAARRGVSSDNKSTETISETNPDKIPDKDTPHLARNALIPILTIMTITSITMISYGVMEINQMRDKLEIDMRLALRRGDYDVIDNLKEELDLLEVNATNIFNYTDIYRSLLYGMVSGCIVCFVLMKLVGIKYSTSVASFLAGWADMSGALLNLLCAWSLGAATDFLQTGVWVGNLLPENTSPLLLALSIFVVASIIGFAVGSAFGTLTILLGFGITIVTKAHPGDVLLLQVTIGAVLSGAVFGNHASYLADTTVVASAAARVQLASHTITQLPYALLSLSSCFVLGVIPAMLGVPGFVCILMCAVACTGFLLYFGTKIPVYNPAEEKEDIL
ncbi:hypothetical protein P9112_008920 [Eukaryota sp. TZLM1-RC]